MKMALFLKSDLYLALSVLFWRTGRFCVHDRWRDGWKSASERPIWSAFNGMERKAKEGGNHIFLPPLGQSVFSGTFYLE